MLRYFYFFKTKKNITHEIKEIPKLSYLQNSITKKEKRKSTAVCKHNYKIVINIKMA